MTATAGEERPAALRGRFGVEWLLALGFALVIALSECKALALTESKRLRMRALSPAGDCDGRTEEWGLRLYRLEGVAPSTKIVVVRAEFIPNEVASALRE